MSIGHKGMVHAAKAMGMTMADLFQNQKAVAEIKQEFKERKGDVVYEPMIDGPAPINQ
jgi:aminobenzoyl-glutamate utilization protein B